MTKPGYEYHGMLADNWDLFRGDTSHWEDRDFYLEIIRENGQPVLDVGCGTGRLLLDYLSQGIDIDGVDLSPEMLALCQQKAKVMGHNPTLFEADMETMHLPRLYQVIIVPSSSFQLVVDPKAARKTIQNLYRHLQVGGSLVMPFMRLWKKGDSMTIDWHLSGEKVRLTDGATIRRWSKSCFDPESQLEHNETRYELLRDGVVIESEYHKQSPATREYSQEQAFELFINTGFDNLSVYQGFTRIPASKDEEIFTIVAQKLT
jgi:ubiquinone/menaquinone biosynthesis C-methylase UbiE